MKIRLRVSPLHKPSPTRPLLALPAPELVVSRGNASQEFSGVLREWRLALPPVSVLGVCSWLPGEGSREVAEGLAFAAADAGSRVALVRVECGGTRGPFLNTDLGMRLSETELISWTMPASDLTVIEPEPGTSEATIATQLASLIPSLKQSGSSVVVDLPALHSSAAVAKLAPMLDGSILTIHSENSLRTDFELAAATLQRAGPLFLGAVLARHKTHVPGFLQSMFESQA